MIHGLFFDERMWNMDFASSKRWNPESYGVKLDLRTDTHNIVGSKIDSKYKFVIASEVWEEPMRDVLGYLREQGLKVFFMPREAMTLDDNVFFNYDIHDYKGEKYFRPDAVLAPSKIYYNLWRQNTKAYLVGYPKYNYCLEEQPSKDQLIKKHGLSHKRKIFFPSHPPKFYKKDGKKDTFVSTYDAREATIKILERIALELDAQLIIKLHPTTMKEFKKGIKSNDISGITQKYYDNPKEHFKIFGDDRMYGTIAKELLSVSDVVVGYTSTMLLEAALMGKAVVHSQIGTYQNFAYRPRYDMVFDTAFTEDCLYNIVKSVMQDPKPNYDVRGLEIFMHKPDEKCWKRVCEAIIEEVGR